MGTPAPIDVNYREDGAPGAPVLVLSHALGLSMAMWDPQVVPLLRAFRVVRYDHRGHGGSPVPTGRYRIQDFGRDVLRLLDRLAFERVAFCGLSLGGMVGLWLAANAPERVDRLVVCCAAARRPDAVAAIKAQLLATPPEGYAATCEALAAMDLRDDLPRIFASTRVIAAAEDQSTPPEQSEEIARRIPGADLVVIPNAAHLANVEQPEIVTNLVLNRVQ